MTCVANKNKPIPHIIERAYNKIMLLLIIKVEVNRALHNKVCYINAEVNKLAKGVAPKLNKICNPPV